MSSKGKNPLNKEGLVDHLYFALWQQDPIFNLSKIFNIVIKYKEPRVSIPDTVIIKRNQIHGWFISLNN